MRLPMISNVAGAIPVLIGAGLATQRRGRAELFQMSAKIHKARVFEGHKCTTGIHNALLDVVMPELSATTWKILCVLIRQTTGWDREEQGASYATLMAGTGIKSKATIAACLKELEDYRYPLITVQPGRQHELSKYTVNRDVEIEWIPHNFAHASGSKNELLNQSSGSKNELLYGLKNEPLKQSSGSKNELSYRKESNKNLKQEGGNEPLPPVFDVSEIWEEVFGEPITIHAETVLEAESFASEENFRNVLAIWKTNGYSRRNLSDMIARYNEELGKKNKQHSAPAVIHLAEPIPEGMNDLQKTRWVKEQLAKRQQQVAA